MISKNGLKRNGYNWVIFYPMGLVIAPFITGIPAHLEEDPGI